MAATRSPTIRVLVLSFVLIGVVATIGPAGAATPTFPIKALGPFVPMGINEHGDVVGFGGWPTKAFLYTDSGGLKTLPALPGYQNAEAQEINDVGLVVGTSGTIEPTPHATLWVNGQPQDLGTLVPGGSSFGRAINAAGTVVGSAGNGSQVHAFVKPLGKAMIDITPGATNAVAEDVNDLGEVTGRINGKAFRWKADVLQVLGAPVGFTYSSGNGINEKGQIAADVTNAFGSSQRVARHTPGVGWEILGGTGKKNVGWAVNGAGTVVGEGFPGTGLLRAVIFLEGKGFSGLDAFVGATEWFMRSAWDVNEAGQIVVLGYSSTGAPSSALRLTPGAAPPPAGTMHVGDMTLSLARRGSSVVGQAIVPILSATSSPVSGAVVKGNWTVNGVVREVGDSATTAANGSATVVSGNLAAPPGASVGFCVTGVVLASLTYDPGANVDSCVSAIG